MGEKLYYSIGEVAKILGVNTSLLRFWETEIPSIRPRKSQKGTRCYTADDIALLRQIYHLTRDCGYTLEGVRDNLRLHGEEQQKQHLVETLTEMKHFLEVLKEQL